MHYANGWTKCSDRLSYTCIGLKAITTNFNGHCTNNFKYKAFVDIHACIYMIITINYEPRKLAIKTEEQEIQHIIRWIFSYKLIILFSHLIFPLTQNLLIKVKIYDDVL